MKVKFANAEVDVWMLKKGVVLGCGSQFVHLNGISVYDSKVHIAVVYGDGVEQTYNSCDIDWLHPH